MWLSAAPSTTNTGLPERYAVLVKRVKEGEVLSFKQAEKYDRLGRFLLRFPRFVYQIQLVSLSDWQQKFGPKVLMGSIETILDEEQLQFWQESVSVDEEVASEGMLLMPERSAAEMVVENASGSGDAGEGPRSNRDSARGWTIASCCCG